VPCSRRIGIARSRSRKPLPASGSRAGAMRLHHQGFVVGAFGYDPDAPSLPTSGVDIHLPGLWGGWRCERSLVADVSVSGSRSKLPGHNSIHCPGA
jgi:hypothetical protein